MIAFDCLFLVFCHLTLLEASEASEQSERAKLSGAIAGFPLLTHAFAGVPLPSMLGDLGISQRAWGVLCCFLFFII